MKEEAVEDDSYYEGDTDLMDTEFLEEDVPLNTSDLSKTPEFAIANVSCQYDGSPGKCWWEKFKSLDPDAKKSLKTMFLSHYYIL